MISRENEIPGRRKTALGFVNSHFAAFLEKVDTSEGLSFKLEDVHVCDVSSAAASVGEKESHSEIWDYQPVNKACSVLVSRIC